MIGASGQLGHAVASCPIRRGWQVTAVTRGGRPLHPDLPGTARWLDGTNQSLAALLAETGPVDAVFDPTIYTADQAGTVLAAAPRFGSLIAVSSASVYADAAGNSLGTANFPDFPAPIREDQPTVAPGLASYSIHKVAMEQRLLASPHPVSILRPCAIHGLHARHPREWWLIKRALDGRRAIPVAYNGESRFHTTAAASLASLAVLCMERPAQRVLNVADADALSVADMAATLARILGLSIPLAPFASPPADHVGATLWSTPGPLVVDCTKAQSLGWSAPPYAEAVIPYAPWLAKAGATAGPDWPALFPVFATYGRDPFDYEAEDGFLATH